MLRERKQNQGLQSWKNKVKLFISTYSWPLLLIDFNNQSLILFQARITIVLNF